MFNHVFKFMSIDALDDILTFGFFENRMQKPLNVRGVKLFLHLSNRGLLKFPSFSLSQCSPDRIGRAELLKINTHTHLILPR
jgi:hypothetical protein